MSGYATGKEVEEMDAAEAATILGVWGGDHCLLRRMHEMEDYAVAVRRAIDEGGTSVTWLASVDSFKTFNLTAEGGVVRSTLAGSTKELTLCYKAKSYLVAWPSFEEPCEDVLDHLPNADVSKASIIKSMFSQGGSQLRSVYHYVVAATRMEGTMTPEQNALLRGFKRRNREAEGFAEWAAISGPLLVRLLTSEYGGNVDRMIEARPPLDLHRLSGADRAEIFSCIEGLQSLEAANALAERAWGLLPAARDPLPEDCFEEMAVRTDIKCHGKMELYDTVVAVLRSVPTVAAYATGADAIVDEDALPKLPLAFEAMLRKAFATSKEPFSFVWGWRAICTHLTPTKEVVRAKALKQPSVGKGGKGKGGFARALSQSPGDPWKAAAGADVSVVMSALVCAGADLEMSRDYRCDRGRSTLEAALASAEPKVSIEALVASLVSK